MIRISKLGCGIELVTETMTDVESVTIGFWVGTGSRDETDREAGASHFLEHLLFKGTATRTAREIAESIDAVGGDMNGFTTKEYTSFYVRVLSENLDLALDILGDIVWSPALTTDDLEAERQVILEEILAHGDEPTDLVHERFAATVFPGHSLGREIMGSSDTIATITAGEVRGFFESHYRPGNMVIAAAGDIDHDQIAAGVELRLAEKKGGSAPERLPPDLPPRRLDVSPRATEQAHLVLGMRALDRHDPDRWALAALNMVLGGGASSRLFQEVRERRSLAYSVYSERASYHDTGTLSVYIGTGPNRATQVVSLVSREIDRLAEEGITGQELDRAIAHMRAETLLSLEDSAARMGRIGRGLLLHGEVLSTKELMERISSVSSGDVRRVAERVLSGPRTLAVVGPFNPEDFAAWEVA